MSFKLNIFRHLLPRARAWDMMIDKKLRQFFQGLTSLPAAARDYLDGIWEDNFPATTRELRAWENQYGLNQSTLSDSERRTRIAAARAALGGQSWAYIEDTLQDHGFNVYVHQWWVPGTNPPVARNPFTYITTTRVPLVNKVQRADRNYTVLCGEPLAECGEPTAECGEFDGVGFWYKDYEPINDPNYYPFYLYIGGSTFGVDANVPADRRDEFENLCLKLCPLQHWILFFVNYT